MIVKTDYDGLNDLIVFDENVPNNKNAKHLFTILMCDDVMESLEKFKFEIIEYIPELSETLNYNQNNPHHHLDLWYHTINAIAYSEKNFKTRIALLFHDISKPQCCIKDKNGISHYPGHNEKSAEMANAILTRLGWSQKFIQEVCDIIGIHDKDMTEEFIVNNLELAKKILKVQMCDIIAHNPQMNEKKLKYMNEAVAMINKIESN